jgi:hypothetical protein
VSAPQPTIVLRIGTRRSRSPARSPTTGRGTTTRQSRATRKSTARAAVTLRAPRERAGDRRRRAVGRARRRLRAHRAGPDAPRVDRRGRPTPSDADGGPTFGGGDVDVTVPAPCPAAASRRGLVNLLLTPGGFRIGVLTTLRPSRQPRSPARISVRPSRDALRRTPFAVCPTLGPRCRRSLGRRPDPRFQPLSISMDGTNTIASIAPDIIGTTTVQFQTDLRGVAVATDVSARHPDLARQRRQVTLSCPRKATAGCTARSPITSRPPTRPRPRRCPRPRRATTRASARPRGSG